MDMRQAAEFFKTRWKWRKEPDWYREEQAKRAERQKAAVAAKRAAKTSTNGTGSSESSTPEKGGQQGSQQPSNDPQSGKQAPQKQPINKQQQAVKDRQQQVIDLYLQQVLESLGKVEQSPAVKKMMQDTLELLRVKIVEPKMLLDFGKELARLEATNKPLKEKMIATRTEARKGGNRDVWEKMDKELAHLQDLERKGKTLEFSGNLAGTTMGILDAFLGPAGPLFKTARDLHAEYKDDAKGLLVKFGRVPAFVRAKVDKLKKIWSSRDSLFKRLFPKFALALDKFGSKLKDMGSSLMDKLKLGKGKGKFGKLAAGAAAVGSFLTSDIGKAVSLLGISGIASMFGKKSEAAEKPTATTEKPDKESPWSIQGITSGLSKAASTVTGLFGDLSGWMSDSWKRLTRWASGAYGGLASSVRMAELKVRILKDDVEEQRDKMWDSITGWFDELWEKIKSFIPESIRNAGSQVAEKAGQAVDWTKEKANQAAVMTRDVLGIKTDPAGGDGVAKPRSIQVAQVGDAASGKKAVKVQSGVNLSGMNTALMNNFYAMAGEYNRLTGKTVQVNSAFRSKEEQAQLKAMYPGKAATPGYSMHEYGLAIDINSADANAMENMGLFSKFGFVRPVSGEAWHIEPLAIQGMKSAIRKGNTSVDAAVAASGQGSSTAQAKTESEGNVAQAVQTATQQTKTDVTAAASAAVMPPTVQQAQAPKASEAKTPTLAQSFAKPNAASGPSTVDVATTSMAGVPQAQSSVATVGPMDANVSMPMPPVPTGPATLMASVAPKLDAQYERVESRSKRLDKTLENAPIDPEVSRSNNHKQTGANNIPFYLGDMGMLTLNLGIGA